MIRKRRRRYCEAHNHPFRVPAYGTAAYKEWELKREVRSLCRRIYYRAMKTGRLEHWRGKKCTDCGQPAQGYDHRNYYYPTKVDAVCFGCNMRRGERLPYLGTQTEKDYREAKGIPLEELGH